MTDAADQPYSYVFVTTKAIPEVTKTPDMLRPLLSAPYTDRYPQPTYVLVQNGLNVEKDLYDALVKLGNGSPSIISTALYIGTNLLAPNVVEHNHFVSWAPQRYCLSVSGVSPLTGPTFPRSLPPQRSYDDCEFCQGSHVA